MCYAVGTATKGGGFVYGKDQKAFCAYCERCDDVATVMVDFAQVEGLSASGYVKTGFSCDRISRCPLDSQGMRDCPIYLACPGP